MRRKVLILFFCVITLLVFSCGVSKSLQHQPEVTGYNSEKPIVVKHSDSLFSSGNNYLIKNKQKIWELYVSGDPLERGLLTGALTQPLLQKQEKIFFSKVQELVPSKFKQKVLREFLKWYNRKLYLHITEEYKAEIYGLSQYASDEFNFIAPNYLRSLYLHGAHDIGHAMQDLALVGCSSMAVWGDKSEDGQLLIGRNFDFYAGDAFAEEKIVAFIQPDTGHPFMMVTWGGMMGVVSGMNKEGLTVTINAGKSEIPLVAKTPISLVAREILQYAATVEEAITIAKKRQVFVSESIMIGSAKNQKAILIEVSPEKFGIYEVPNSNQLVCSNHFQSGAYQNDAKNQQHIMESHSQYRFERMQELLQQQPKMNPQRMVEILRNKEGLENVSLGYGNEKALNQLLAHHGIVFQPERKKVWVSANPYQLGAFVAYDLDAVFAKKENDFVVLSTDSMNIPKDAFLNTTAYQNYEKYRIQDRIMDKTLSENERLEIGFTKEYQNLNPEHWSVYYKTGKYFFNRGWYKAAELEFQKALTKVITTVPDRVRLGKYLQKTRRKQQ